MDRWLASGLVLLLTASSATALLTAGDVDDHLNWDDYLSYVDRLAGDQQSDLPFLDLAGRQTIRIVDEDGDAWPLALVASGGDSMRTGADGKAHLWPGDASTVTVTTASGSSEHAMADTIVVDGDAPEVSKLDIAFVIDTTGSMSDELEFLKDELQTIISSVIAQQQGVHVRLALTVYRDHGDDYVVRNYGFSPDLATADAWLDGQSANGGGDYPEAMEQGIKGALDAQWRSDALKLMFLVADAPPHEAAYDDFLDAVGRARNEGVRIHPLAASGVADEAEYLMRAAAVQTGGRYMFLTDDSGIGNAHAEPSIPCYIVTDLVDLLDRVMRSEITGTRVEPDPADIVREVGEYEMGVCLGQPEQQDGSDGSHDHGDTSEMAGSGDGMSDGAPRESSDGADGDVSLDDFAPGGDGGVAEDEASEESPGIGIALVIASIGALALFRRRR